MLIASELEGQEGYFVFDTGADAIVINKQVDQHDVLAFETLTGAINTSKIVVNKITLGNYVLNDIQAFAYDLSSVEKFTNKKLLGIIGTRFLEGEVLFIDNINNVIQILDRNQVKNTSGQQFITSKIWLENGVPIVPLKIDGKEYKFGLDTGSSVSVINNQLVKANSSVFSQNSAAVNVHTLDKNEVAHQQTVVIEIVQFGKMGIKNLQFGITELKAINDELDVKIDGIISLNQIPIKEIYIDFEKLQILLLP